MALIIGAGAGKGCSRSPAGEGSGASHFQSLMLPGAAVTLMTYGQMQTNQ